MKVEHFVDGARGGHDGLRDDLTSIDTFGIPITDPQGGTISARATHLSLPEEVADWWTGRGRRQRVLRLTMKPNPWGPGFSYPRHCGP